MAWFAKSSHSREARALLDSKLAEANRALRSRDAELAAARAELAQRDEMKHLVWLINHKMADLSAGQSEVKKVLVESQRHRRISVRDLLSRSGPSFIDACYVHLLGRLPEESGRWYHDVAMRNGLPKQSIIVDMYRTEEARIIGARIRGIRMLLLRHGIAQFGARVRSGIETRLETMAARRAESRAEESLPAKLVEIESLLRFDYAEFIYNCYRTLLGREPDANGLRDYLRKLEAGMAKSRIIGDLTYSSEGKANNVCVRGLWWRYALSGRPYK